MNQTTNYSAALLFRYNTGVLDYIIPLCEKRRIFAKIQDTCDPVDYFNRVGILCEISGLRFVAILEIQKLDNDICNDEGPFWHRFSYRISDNNIKSNFNSVGYCSNNESVKKILSESNYYVELVFCISKYASFVTKIKISNYIFRASSLKEAIEKCNNYGLKTQRKDMVYLGIFKLLSNDIVFERDDELGYFDFWYDMKRLPVFLLYFFKCISNHKVNHKVTVTL